VSVAFASTDTITCSYTPGTIVANDGGVLAGFSGVSVTNNVAGEVNIVWNGPGSTTNLTQATPSSIIINDAVLGGAVSNDYLTDDGYLKCRIQTITSNINVAFQIGFNYRNFSDQSSGTNLLGYFGASYSLIVKESGANSKLGSGTASSGLYLKIQRSGTVITYYTSTDDITYTLYYTSVISSSGNIYPIFYFTANANDLVIDNIKLKKSL
jgi:hypothetical protein